MKKPTLLERKQSQVTEQRKWLERCGGDLAGYIAHYGDPGVPPINPETGTFKTVTVPNDKAELFTDHEVVSRDETTTTFYCKHFGEGGSAIYKADKDRLDLLERDFADYRSRCGVSGIYAS